MKKVRFSLHSNAYKFGNRIQELRKEKKLTQKEFAEDFKTHDSYNQEIGVTLDTVQNWEQHYNLPDTGTLLDLAEYFNVNVDYLLGRIDQKTHEIEDVSKITLLSPQAVEIVLSNREKIYNAPLTAEQIEYNDQLVKDGVISSWEPLPEYTIDIDKRNVEFLSALIESDEFRSLYSNFYFISSELEMYKHFDNEWRAMQKMYDHPTKAQMDKERHLLDERRYYELRSMEAKNKISALFSQFLDNYESKFK